MTSEDSLDLANPQPEVEVCSLSTGEWKVIRIGLFRISTLRCLEPHAFVNGAKGGKIRYDPQIQHDTTQHKIHKLWVEA